MAPTIGAVSCDIINGGVSGPSTRARQWETPGVDGRGVQKLGLTPGRFQFSAIKWGSLSTVRTWASDIEALKNESVVTIEDSRGTSHANCVIGFASPTIPKSVLHEGSSQYRSVIQISGHIRIV